MTRTALLPPSNPLSPIPAGAYGEAHGQTPIGRHNDPFGRGGLPLPHGVFRVLSAGLNESSLAPADRADSEAWEAQFAASLDVLGDLYDEIMQESSAELTIEIR